MCRHLVLGPRATLNSYVGLQVYNSTKHQIWNQSTCLVKCQVLKFSGSNGSVSTHVLLGHFQLRVPLNQYIRQDQTYEYIRQDGCPKMRTFRVLAHVEHAYVVLGHAYVVGQQEAKNLNFYILRFLHYIFSTLEETNGNGQKLKQIVKEKRVKKREL